MGFALGRVPAVEAEPLLGPAVALDGLVGGLFLDGQAELLQPGRGLVQAPARQDVAEGAGSLVHLVHARVLGQVAEPAGDLHHAPVGIGLAGQHPQQRRLARAVATGQADLVPGAHGEAGVLEGEHPTDLDRQLAHRQHRSSLARGAPDASRVRSTPEIGEETHAPAWFSTPIYLVHRRTSRDRRPEHRLLPVSDSFRTPASARRIVCIDYPLRKLSLPTADPLPVGRRSHRPCQRPLSDGHPGQTSRGGLQSSILASVRTSPCVRGWASPRAFQRVCGLALGASARAHPGPPQILVGARVSVGDFPNRQLLGLDWDRQRPGGKAGFGRDRSVSTADKRPEASEFSRDWYASRPIEGGLCKPTRPAIPSYCRSVEPSHGRWRTSSSRGGTKDGRAVARGSRPYGDGDRDRQRNGVSSPWAVRHDNPAFRRARSPAPQFSSDRGLG